MLIENDNRRPPCPVDTSTQEWIDARASWLLHQFGAEWVRMCPVVTPTEEFFPGAFRGTEDDARALLDRLCHYMKLNPRSIELSVYYEGERVDGGHGTLGLYEQGDRHFRVWVEQSLLRDPLALAATMTHELGHVHLLGHGRVREDEDDHEPLTDLLTVFLGLGVITSNAALHSVNWQSGLMEGWRIARHGYFTMDMYGYALALFSTVREEHSPRWPRHLRLDVRDAYRKSLKCFKKHGAPDLRTVTTTTARPLLFRDKSPAEQRSDDQAPAPEVVACCYCEAPLPGNREVDICDECQESIDENVKELEAERQQAEQGLAWRQRFFKLGLLGFIALLLFLLALGWLGVIR